MYLRYPNRLLVRLGILLTLSFGAFAQDPPAADPPPAPAPATLEHPPTQAAQTTIPDQGRILGILPNYKTVPDRKMNLPPLTPSGKLGLATQDSFDWSSILVAGYYAGTEQLEGQYQTWGQGMAGFGRRFAAGYADNAIGDYMTEGIFPTLLHEDPRYYRMGEGGFFKRTLWAMSRIVVTKNDAGGMEFNRSEFAGNAVAAGISTLYYPAQSRTFSDVFQKWYVQCGTDAFFNVLKEFWPDVRSRFSRHPPREN